ncbi:MAG TPA: hypothetical protein VGF68_06025 [Solirubrobacteraceae bacterium]
MPSSEPMAQIAPRRRARIRGTTARHALAVPPTWTSSMRRHSASSGAAMDAAR